MTGFILMREIFDYELLIGRFAALKGSSGHFSHTGCVNNTNYIHLLLTFDVF